MLWFTFKNLLDANSFNNFQTPSLNIDIVTTFMLRLQAWSASKKQKENDHP